MEYSSTFYSSPQRNSASLAFEAPQSDVLSRTNHEFISPNRYENYSPNKYNNHHNLSPEHLSHSYRQVETYGQENQSLINPYAQLTTSPTIHNNNGYTETENWQSLQTKNGSVEGAGNFMSPVNLFGAPQPNNVTQNTVNSTLKSDQLTPVEMIRSPLHSKPSEFLSPTHQSNIFYSQPEASKVNREDMLSPEICKSRKKTDELLRKIVIKYGLDSLEEAAQFMAMYASRMEASRASIISNLRNSITHQRPVLSTITDNYNNQYGGTDYINVQDESKIIHSSPMKTNRGEEFNGQMEDSFRSPGERRKKGGLFGDEVGRFDSPGNAGQETNYRNSYDNHNAKNFYSDTKWDNRHSLGNQGPRYGNLAQSHIEVPKMSYRLGDMNNVKSFDKSDLLRNGMPADFDKFYQEIMEVMTSPQRRAALEANKKSYNTGNIDRIQDMSMRFSAIPQKENLHSRFVSYDLGKENPFQAQQTQAGNNFEMSQEIYSSPYADRVSHMSKVEPYREEYPSFDKNGGYNHEEREAPKDLNKLFDNELNEFAIKLLEEEERRKQGRYEVYEEDNEGVRNRFYSESSHEPRNLENKNETEFEVKKEKQEAEKEVKAVAKAQKEQKVTQIKEVEKGKGSKVYLVVVGLIMLILFWLAIILLYPDVESMF